MRWETRLRHRVTHVPFSADNPDVQKACGHLQDIHKVAEWIEQNYEEIPMVFDVKDSGERAQYASGMQRDTESGKFRFDLVFDGPLVARYAAHLTKGATKYTPRNWMKASGSEELERFRSSAARHFSQWMAGDVDEDHMAAVVFNLNAYEYLKEKLGGVRVK